MTARNKTPKGKGSAKPDKLQLKKETLKDLASPKDKAAAIKGGRAGACCGGNTFTRDE